MSKTILHPTDFSSCAENAMGFAIELAKSLNYKIAMVHSLDFSEISVTSRNAQALEENSNALEAEAKKKLVELGTKIQEHGVQCEATIHHGRINYWLPDYAKEVGAEYIVMGTVGADTLHNKIMGSHTFDIVTRTPIPVLAVPNEAHIDNFKEFVYLQDHRTPDIEPLRSLAEIATAFNGNIDVVHFIKDPSDDADLNLFEQLKTEVKKEIDFDFNFISEPTNDLHESIQQIVTEKKPDLLALVMRHQNFFQRLFRGSLTEKLVNHSHTPILAFED